MRRPLLAFPLVCIPTTCGSQSAHIAISAQQGTSSCQQLRSLLRSTGSGTLRNRQGRRSDGITDVRNQCYMYHIATYVHCLCKLVVLFSVRPYVRVYARVCARAIHARLRYRATHIVYWISPPTYINDGRLLQYDTCETDGVQPSSRRSGGPHFLRPHTE